MNIAEAISTADNKINYNLVIKVSNADFVISDLVDYLHLNNCKVNGWNYFTHLHI